MRDFVKATARLLLGLAVLVGVPAALCIAIGWPLPRSVPSWTEVRDGFDRQGVPIDTAIGVLAVIVWCAWAQLAVAVLIELAATVRGRATRRIALLPGAQTVARQFVASAVLVVSMLGAGRSGAAAAGASPLAAIEVTHTAANHAPPASGRAAVATPPAPAAAPGEYIVQPGDSYWGLAETHLGDGTRWSEIRDGNVGRTVDGRRTITPLDDDLHPGWRILLLQSSAASITAPATAGEVVVGPGDHFWSLAETRLTDEWGRPATDAEVRAYWEVLVEANRERLAPPGDPNVIHPGEVFVTPPPGPDPAQRIPPAPPPVEAQPDDIEEPAAGEAGGPESDPPLAPPADAPGEADSGGLDEPEAGQTGASNPESDPAAANDSTEPAPATTTAPRDTSVTDPADGGPDTSVDGSDHDRSDAPIVPVLGVASGALAVAVLRELRRRRQHRAIHLPFDVVPSPPPRSTRPVATEVLTADEQRADVLDAALANLCDSLRPRGGEGCVQPKVVQVTGQRIEVLLDRPDPSPPAPWRPEASGRVWVLVDGADLAVLDTAPPLPALVTIGVDEAELLLDLEAFGVVTLTGDPDNCWAMARSMVTELAAKADGAISIELVGALDGRLDHLDGIRRVDDWDEVDIGVIAGSARMLDAGRWPHTFAARASGRVFDGWAPAIWVTAPSDNGRYHDTVDRIATRPGAGSAVVVVAGDAEPPPAGGVHVIVDADGAFRIPELTLVGRAQLLHADPADQIVELLDDATHTAYADTIEFPTLDPADHELVVDDDLAEFGLGDDWLPPDDETANDHETAGEPDTPDVPPADASAAADQPAAVARSLAPEHDRYEDPPWNVLVRVCGEIVVEGGKQVLDGPEAAAATYVALHREADVDEIRNAIWGGRDVTRKRVRNVLANMRKAFRDEDMFYVTAGRLAAGDECLTDHELIRRRLAYARHQSNPAAKAETLRDALEWVTGKVCSYPSRARRTWGWIDLDNWIPAIESTVGMVAHDLADIYLELGDAEGATWAATRGIDATGPREQLTVLLVRGYALTGDDPAAAAALRAYERCMEDLGGAEHSEDLLELLDRFLPTGRARAS